MMPGRNGGNGVRTGGVTGLMTGAFKTLSGRGVCGSGTLGRAGTGTSSGTGVDGFEIGPGIDMGAAGSSIGRGVRGSGCLVRRIAATGRGCKASIVGSNSTRATVSAFASPATPLPSLNIDGTAGVTAVR